MHLKLHLTRVFLILVCITGAYILLQSFNAFAAADPTASGRITEPDGVNIRSSYSTSSTIINALPYNTTVTVEQEKFTKTGVSTDTTVWYKINSSYGSGYIRSDLASVTYNYADATVNTGANLRLGPGTTFSSAGLISKGSSVKVALKAINASGYSWYKIYYNGSYYYISSSYLTLGSNSSSSGGGALSDEEFEAMLTSEGFPESYKTALRALHQQHPNWQFRAKQLAFSWEDALDQQCANVNANLVSTNFADSYKEVASGTYDFTNHTYIGKDGSSWVAASREGVAYYMDPRNWLDETSIFMFEPNVYDPSYQTESLVSQILSTTALPSSAAKYYIEAARQTYNGKTYEISPVYLATKTRLELGSSDFMVNGHSFTYGGKSYSGLYNTYNIGAVDSADGSAATKGLVYAAGGTEGATTYLRPWNTLEKAIKGGAIYIASTFLERNQYTAYYERYNVLNGLSSIGTYQYATSIFSAATQSAIIYGNYYDFKVLDEAFTFEIPVYQDMPSQAAAKPGSGNNNNYLDSIEVYNGSTKLALSKTFSRFTTSYSLTSEVPSSVSKLTVQATANASDAKVEVSGNTGLSYGTNKIQIKVTSSSGKVRTYTLTVVRAQGSEEDEYNEYLKNGVENTTLKIYSQSEPGAITISWEREPGFLVDGYELYRSAGSADNFKRYDTTTKTSYRNANYLVAGTKYYYKVRGYRTIAGETVYTQWSKTIYRTAQAAEEETTDEETAYNEYLKNGVENTTLKIYSQSEAGAITISWVREPGFLVDGYELYRAAGSTDNFKRYDTTTKTSYRNANYLVKGTKYYYKVRGYRTIAGETVYTQWTKTIYRTAK